MRVDKYVIEGKAEGRTVTHEDVRDEKGTIAGADEKLKGRDCEWDNLSRRDAYQYEK
jgi:hypothetical protein